MTKISAAVLTLLVSACPPALALDYTLRGIVTSPPPQSAYYAQEGYAINSQGWVVGTYQDHRHKRPFLHNGAWKFLDVPNEFGSAHAINDSGQVVGSMWTYGSNGGQLVVNDHAFMYDGSVHDLGTLGGPRSYAFGINNDGLVTGRSEMPDDVGRYEFHAFVHNGVMHDIGTLGGAFSSGEDINASGHVTGWSSLADENLIHAFVYDGVTMKGIGTLGGPESRGIAINDLGHVVGVSRISWDTNTWRGFFYDGTTMHDIGGMPLFPGQESPPVADINNHDQIVVGKSFWSPTTGLRNFVDFGLYMARVSGINDAGQIVGVGEGGAARTFILTPIPEPSTFTVTASLRRASGDSPSTLCRSTAPDRITSSALLAVAVRISAIESLLTFLRSFADCVLESDGWLTSAATFLPPVERWLELPARIGEARAWRSTAAVFVRGGTWRSARMAGQRVEEKGLLAAIGSPEEDAAGDG